MNVLIRVVKGLLIVIPGALLCYWWFTYMLKSSPSTFLCSHMFWMNILRYNSILLSTEEVVVAAAHAASRGQKGELGNCTEIISALGLNIVSDFLPLILLTFLIEKYQTFVFTTQACQRKIKTQFRRNLLTYLYRYIP